jgi:hypothetical protein
VLDTRGDYISKMLGVAGESSGNESGLSAQGHADRIDRNFDISVTGGCGDHIRRGSWRKLALGQAINVVVHYDVSHIDIAPAGMRKMPYAD